MSSNMSATRYGQKLEATKEKVIFRREYDHYLKKWGYLAGFPNDEANRGRIAVVDFKILDDGTVIRGCFDEADVLYFTKLKLVHKNTEEAEQCMKAIKSFLPEENFVVGEKITRKDRCY